MEEKVNKKNVILDFALKHKASILLSLVIIVILSWSLFKISSLKNRYAKEKASIIDVYETRIDSLSTVDHMLIAKMFSLAVRCEMTRGNMEQVNFLLLNLIKESSISKIQLIDSKKGIVLLSTNKKDEGSVITNKQILDADETFNIPSESSIVVVSPVMGLNSKIGILLIEAKRRSTNPKPVEPKS